MRFYLAGRLGFWTTSSHIPEFLVSSEDDFSTSSEAKGRVFHSEIGILTYFHFLGIFTKLFMQCKTRQTLNFQKELWI